MPYDLPPTHDQDGEVNEAFGTIHQIKKEDIKPITHFKGCEHTFIKEGMEGELVSLQCSKCGLGTFVHKDNFKEEDYGKENGK